MVPRSIVWVALPYFLVSRPGSSRPRTSHRGAPSLPPNSRIWAEVPDSFSYVSTTWSLNLSISSLVPDAKA